MGALTKQNNLFWNLPRSTLNKGMMFFIDAFQRSHVEHYITSYVYIYNVYLDSGHTASYIYISLSGHTANIN